MERTAFKGAIVSVGTTILEKANGGKYVLATVLVSEGALKGKNVTAQYTLQNKDGKQKPLEDIAPGTEIEMYHSVVPSTTGEGNKNFFEISRGMIETLSDAEIDALLAGG